MTKGLVTKNGIDCQRTESSITVFGMFDTEVALTGSFDLSTKCIRHLALVT